MGITDLIDLISENNQVESAATLQFPENNWVNLNAALKIQNVYGDIYAMLCIK